MSDWILAEKDDVYEVVTLSSPRTGIMKARLPTRSSCTLGYGHATNLQALHLCDSGVWFRKG